MKAKTEQSVGELLERLVALSAAALARGGRTARKAEEILSKLAGDLELTGEVRIQQQLARIDKAVADSQSAARIDREMARLDAIIAANRPRK